MTVQTPMQDGGTSGEAERILALLIEQRALYQHLSRLTEQQRMLITGDEPERLLTTLAERQRLVDRLMATGRELKPFQANWRQIRQGLDPEQVRGIDALVAEVNGLLSRILEKDEADTALLSARKSQTSKAIGTLQAGRQAGVAYSQSAPESSGMDWSQA